MIKKKLDRGCLHVLQSALDLHQMTFDLLVPQSMGMKKGLSEKNNILKLEII
jgi:hypothetical protein